MNTVRTYSERLSAGSISPSLALATASSSIPAGHAEPRNIVFHEQAVPVG
jgi:hypothetical protein